MVTSTAPAGIGFYARALAEQTHGTPEQLAAKVLLHGGSFVAFMGCWQDRKDGGPRLLPISAERTAKYARAAHAAGLEVWLWGFPWVNRERQYADEMSKMVRACGGVVRGLIHDPEVSYKDRRAKAAPASSRGQGEAVTAGPEAGAATVRRGAQELMRLDRELVTAHGLATSGVTSYGMADWHALPWDVFASTGCWGSPQLYTVSPAQVDQGLRSWRAAGFHELLPSVPAYGDNSGRALDAHLARFVDGDEPDIRGFVVWSYQQVGGVEWSTFDRWATQLRTRQCVPRG